MMNAETVAAALAPWKAAATTCSPEQLRWQPGAGRWSLGQLYHHLIFGTRLFFFRNASQCLISGEHAGEGLSDIGRKVFADRAFPAPRIKYPDPEYVPGLLEAPDAVLVHLGKLEVEYTGLLMRANRASTGGKARHFAFGYLNAPQWLELAAIHFRHHLRQKSELESAWQNR